MKDIEKLELRIKENKKLKNKQDYIKHRDSRLAKAKLKYAEKKKIKNDKKN